MTGPSRRRGLQGLAAAAFAAAALIALLPTTGEADEPTFVGWWHRDVPLSGASPQEATVTGQAAGAPTLASLAAPPAQVPPITVPPPPVLPPVPLPTIPPDVTLPDPGVDVPTPIPVPAGGLLVANDSTGVRAIAAMRFEAPGAGGGVVSLQIAPGSTPSPPINACPALSDWLPGPDQPWSARPAHDCDRISVTGGLSPDGAVMTWDLPDTFRREDGAAYDVLLVPDRSDGTPYQVLFEKPGVDAFTVTSPFPEETIPPEVPLPDDVPPPADAFSPDGFDVGALDPVTPETVPSEVPTPPTVSNGPLDRIVDVLENPTVRRIATALLVALGAYAYWQSNQAEQRAPRLLGALGGGAVVAAARPSPVAQNRGIGRFARDRTVPPRRL